jgi:hypothetical protein
LREERERQLSDFRLVLDTGTFHGLTDAEREAMGREVNAVAADDAPCCSTVLRLRASDRSGIALVEAMSRLRSPDGRSPTSR